MHVLRFGCPTDRRTRILSRRELARLPDFTKTGSSSTIRTKSENSLSCSLQYKEIFFKSYFSPQIISKLIPFPKQANPLFSFLRQSVKLIKPGFSLIRLFVLQDINGLVQAPNITYRLESKR